MQITTEDKIVLSLHYFPELLVFFFAVGEEAEENNKQVVKVMLISNYLH